MIQLKFRSPSGEERPWKLREIVEGQPLGHPSHPMFVHFPVAFYIGVLAFDLMTRLGDFPHLVQAGTFLIIGAQAASVFAVTTGLVDWWQMAKGSEKRKKATQHMLLQFATAGFFLVALILRLPNRDAAEADIAWIVIEAIGVAFLIVGQYIGGILVYQMAMRVRTTRRTPTPTPPAAAAPPESATAPPSTSG
jgi:uncharacterized membrane protein